MGEGAAGLSARPLPKAPSPQAAGDACLEDGSPLSRDRGRGEGGEGGGAPGSSGPLDNEQAF
jgi:hypothetical protein